MNKESILNQIQEAESQIRRLKTLIQADDNDILNSEDNLRVGMYCCLKGKIQLENIQDELMTELNRISVIKDNRKEILIEIMRDSEEMGLYDDSFSAGIPE
jgi:hypothetical protein